MTTKLALTERVFTKATLGVVLVLFLAMAFLQQGATAVPQGATITYSSTENASVRPADSHTSQGGSFTTLVLNVTSQTSKWKAYVGNVTGKITLDNSNNQTIYDWALTTVQGEVYVSRNESVSFSSLLCANDSNITTEQNALSINASTDDSINNTFRQRIHRSFTVGGTGLIANSTCYAVSTYINDTVQVVAENATFQEILLADGRSLVYTSLLVNDRAGFDTNPYDFQVIVPDEPTETTTTYFFYAELG